MDEVFTEVPFGVPNEPTQWRSASEPRILRVIVMGSTSGASFHCDGNLLALGTFVRWLSCLRVELPKCRIRQTWSEAMLAI